MKGLIWFACCFGYGFITVLLSNSGIRMGAIPTALLIGLTFWIARKLCRMWDIHAISKAATKEGVSEFEYVKSKTPSYIIRQLEDLDGDSSAISKLLIECVKGKDLKQIYADFLYDGYHKR